MDQQSRYQQKTLSGIFDCDEESGPVALASSLLPEIQLGPFVAIGYDLSCGLMF